MRNGGGFPVADGRASGREQTTHGGGVMSAFKARRGMGTAVCVATTGGAGGTRRRVMLGAAAVVPIGPFRRGGSPLRLLRLTFACLAVLALLAAVAGPAAGVTVPTVSNYTGTGISFPHGIAAGPDGALWFTNETNRSIGRITTGGV